MGIIDTNMVVSVHYTLREDGNHGEVLEDTFGGAPLIFTYGVGQMIPGFEKNLLGKSKGDKFDFLLAPGEAYGDAKHNAIVEVPLSNFGNEEGIIDPKVVSVGLPIRMKNQNGQSFQGIIREVGDTKVKVDFNHPMAGRSLHFSGEIIDVTKNVGQA